MSQDAAQGGNLASTDLLRLRVLQFNTLGKHLAEVIQFPYAVDVVAERSVMESDNGDSQRARYENWDAYGVSSWIRRTLDETGMSPAEYILGSGDEGGTFSVEVGDSNQLIYSWTERLPLLIWQIETFQADLIFLQEIELGTLPQFAERLHAHVQNLGAESAETSIFGDDSGIYEGIYCPRATTAQSDGIAMLWRKSSGIHASDVPKVLRYTDGKKLALVQPLSVAAERLNFHAVTTHLHWDPAAPYQEREMEELIAEISQCHAVLLGGDLNCDAASSCLQVAMDAGFRRLDDFLPNDEDRMKFSVHVPRAPVPKVTDARQWQDRERTRLHPVAVDHILAGGAIPDRLVEVGKLIPGGAEGFVPSATNGLPRKGVSASDHLPIGYELVMR